MPADSAPGRASLLRRWADGIARWLGAEVPSAVSAAVWASAAAVVTLLAAGVRSGLCPAALVANTLLGVSLGCAILGVKLILH